jgi:hypothetical protein
MKSTNTYYWNDHSITVNAKASAKFLWMDYKFDVYIDDEHCFKRTSYSWLCSSTRFKIKHENAHVYGQVVSSGFPCTPVITQATIMDDSIIGHSQLWVRNRWLTYGVILVTVLILI